MKLTIFMKSGNKIKTYGVKDYLIENRGDEIVSFKIEYGLFNRYFPKNRLLIKTISLSQIEAVTRSWF